MESLVEAAFRHSERESMAALEEPGTAPERPRSALGWPGAAALLLDGLAVVVAVSGGGCAVSLF